MLRVGEVWRRRRRDDAGLVRVCADGDLADGEIRRIDGLPAVLCRTRGGLYALGLRCPHAGALLVKGTIVDDCLECPLHGGRFALDGGAVRSGPPRHGVPVYDVLVRDGLVYVSRRPRKVPRRAWGGRRLSERRRTGAAVAQPAAASRWRAR
ncbi:Rieske 2Fe-2S domain-containing protein [Actinoallomurus sp. NBC_01490]|uniref:Rieske (2Fe-2S) protein n=1 Tax=Actinoallomurus sp. NBC_01490 TaxID=2903557 RepID=UPI002E370278|nr:Rieske 2Fe-2S domain-containing protein [Actinoallomurus sp. NBC_01490]